MSTTQTDLAALTAQALAAWREAIAAEHKAQQGAPQ